MNLITNALKYTPSGYIRVSLKQEPKPGSHRHFNGIFTVSDTGIGMSKKFQSDRLFHDFAQEDTLSDGLGLGLHMVSRIVHAMGGKIEVVSNQGGPGTCVTVLVPLEHSQNCQHRSDAWDKKSIASPKVFEVLNVGLVTGMDATANFENSSTAAVSALAIASMENNLKFLGVQSERCKWQSVKSYDLMIVMEAELAGCLAMLRNSVAAADKDGNNLTPVLVICNSGPSARILGDLWATDDLQSHVTMEHVALPCGIKQITQAISSALRQQEKRKMASSEMAEVYRESRGKSSAVGVTLRDIRTSNEPQLRSLAPPSASLANLELNPAWTPPSEPSSIEVTSAVGTTNRHPILLLVDDNNINLKLLATFAKKYKYPHLTAQNGQLAVDAFTNAHINHSSSNNIEAQDIRTVAIGMPNIIIMDINMPVMDGYEAVQRIRSYEKKHHITASKIIAVTALQSEAAQAEAFGSGFDMFLSKPLKMKDLAKLIELYRPG
jgi:CheY-like chemotaxis protein